MSRRSPIPHCLFLLLLSRALLGYSAASFQLDFPGNRLVFQRDPQNRAQIPFRGHSRMEGDIEVRFNRIVGAKTNLTMPWLPLAHSSTNGSFAGSVTVSNGWYSVDLRAKSSPDIVEPVLERVGVGEVFIVVGHSVAQGGDLNLPGATDDRVQTFALNEADLHEYELTAKPDLLPRLVGVHFETGVKPAPFGHGPYFWARFAEEVARREDVPVLLLNAGFGGTSLEHWAKSARGEQFEHGFVRSALRMPYINLENALLNYARVLGVRAILSDQGQNDWPEPNANIVFENYRTVIHHARRDLGYEKLAFIVNRQTPGVNSPEPRRQIRAAQERIIREVPDCFPGPDYDHLGSADRPDGIHLGPSGLENAAKFWADAVTPDLLRQIAPFIPISQ